MTEEQILEALHMKAVGDAYLAFLVHSLEKEQQSRSAVSKDYYGGKGLGMAEAQTRTTKLSAEWSGSYRDQYIRSFNEAWEILESEAKPYD